MCGFTGFQLTQFTDPECPGNVPISSPDPLCHIYTWKIINMNINKNPSDYYADKDDSDNDASQNAENFQALIAPPSNLQQQAL
ncbi:unnamed protein product [Linum trigynum]|uniref:Uncharacterized protein n=1 Tax=Linum trigynum TaxID=586398 RepID=A0AAV2F7Q2_9ROSI